MHFCPTRVRRLIHTLVSSRVAWRSGCRVGLLVVEITGRIVVDWFLKVMILVRRSTTPILITRVMVLRILGLNVIRSVLVVGLVTASLTL